MVRLLVEEGIDPSVGSVGDSYDNAMAESIIGLFNNRLLLEPIGDIPPVELAQSYYDSLAALAVATGLK